MDPLTALTLVSTTLSIIDKVADQIARFSKDEPDDPEEGPHRVLAEMTGDVIF